MQNIAMVLNPRKRYEYEKARLLRKRGLSYNSIMAMMRKK